MIQNRMAIVGVNFWEIRLNHSDTKFFAGDTKFFAGDTKFFN
jgi:hypothetical protein